MKKLFLALVVFGLAGASTTASAIGNRNVRRSVVPSSNQPTIMSSVAPSGNYQAASPSAQSTMIPGMGLVYYACPWGWRLQYGYYNQTTTVFVGYDVFGRPVYQYVNKLVGPGYYCSNF